MTVPAIVLAAAAMAAGHPVPVTCEPGQSGYIGGHAIVNGAISLSVETCRLARRRNGAGVVAWVMAHEAAHTIGIVNENQADCFALDNTYRLLRKVWRLTPRAARRGLAEGREFATYGCVR